MTITQDDRNNIPKISPFEEFVPVNFNGEIIERYSVSSFGRIYDHNRDIFLPYHTDRDGYFRVSIRTVSSGSRNGFVHRIEIMSFNPIPNFKDMQVNHKNGIKQDLLITNLEWVFPIENTRHGWDTNLNQCRGLNNGRGKHDEETIHTICKLIDLGLRDAEICNIFEIVGTKERMRFSATINGIRKGKTHRYISKDYKFMEGANIQNRYGYMIAECVCQFLTDQDHHYTYTEIMDQLKIEPEYRKNFRVYIDDIRGGRTAKPISQKYDNLKKPLDDMTIKDEPSTTIERYIPGMIYMDQL